MVERLEIEAAEEDEQPFVITITHGYSKDHRDDLKQFVLNMITIGNSRIPLWVELLSGNAADKKSFRETILSFLDAIKGSGRLTALSWTARSTPLPISRPSRPASSG